MKHLLLPLALAAALLVGACTGDDDKTTPTPGADSTASATATEAPSAGDLDRDDVSAGTEFVAGDDLFQVSYPRAWVAEEHPDGAGVMVGSSLAALERARSGAALAAGELVVNITLTPTTQFETIFLSPEPGSGAEAIAAAILPVFAPVSGEEGPPSEVVNLGAARPELAWAPPSFVRASNDRSRTCCSPTSARPAPRTLRSPSG